MSSFYEHRQFATPTFIGVVVTAGTAAAMLASAHALVPALVVVAIATLIMLIFGSLTVHVDETTLRLRFGIGLIRKTIDLDRVRSHGVVRNHWYYGWGIRLIPGGWLYNVSGLDAVELRRDNGRVTRVGTDEPRALADALARAGVKRED